MDSLIWLFCLRPDYPELMHPRSYRYSGGGPGSLRPRQALLDTIYLRKAIPFRDELEFALLDRQRLDQMAKDFPGPTRKLAQIIRLN